MSDDRLEISITPTCLVCDRVGVVVPDNPTDDSLVTCANPDCGAMLGTYRDFQAKVREAAADKARALIRKAFDDSGFK